MLFSRPVIIVAALAVAASFSSKPAAAQSRNFGLQPGYNQGYERGQRAGLDDGRRAEPFRFDDEADYRRGDIGYRSDYGSKDRYRSDFRLGFEAGYRSSYRRYDGQLGRAGAPPPWSNGRGIGNRSIARYDLAAQFGYNDGYEAGLRDGQKRRSFDPISEGRYRSGDHGYERSYGSRDVYKANYRDTFRMGYEEGFTDGRRYSR